MSIYKYVLLELITYLLVFEKNTQYSIVHNNFMTIKMSTYV